MFYGLLGGAGQGLGFRGGFNEDMHGVLPLLSNTWMICFLCLFGVS